MKIFKKFVIFLRKLYGWYREPIPGYRLIRVDPLTVITIIGLITTSWGVGRGIGESRSRLTIYQIHYG